MADGEEKNKEESDKEESERMKWVREHEELQKKKLQETEELLKNGGLAYIITGTDSNGEMEYLCDNDGNAILGKVDTEENLKKKLDILRATLKPMQDMLDYMESSEWESTCLLFKSPPSEDDCMRAAETDAGRDDLSAQEYLAFFREVTKLFGEADAKSIDSIAALVSRDDGESILDKERAKNKIPRYKTAGNRLLLFSSPQLESAFLSTIKGGGIYVVDEKGKRHQVRDINTPFMQTLFNMLNNAAEYSNSESIKACYPDIEKEMGLDHRSKKETRHEARVREIDAFIKQTESMWGTVPGTVTRARLAVISAWNEETEELIYSSPYLIALRERANQLAKVERIAGNRPKPQTSMLMHASAASERNKAAVELAQLVLIGIQQRGTIADDLAEESKKPAPKDQKREPIESSGVVTYKVSCLTLLKKSPQARARVNAQKATGNKSNVLRRDFTAMYRILKKKTDLFTYYKDAKLVSDGVIPTFSTLDSTQVTFTHRGLNPGYQKPKIGPVEEGQGETKI